MGHKIPLRDKSDAQKNNLKKTPHPMQGKTLTSATKDKISESLGKHWDGMTDKERKQRAQEIADNWQKTWDSYNATQKRAVIDRLLYNQKPGQSSKLEESIAKQLCNKGYIVEQRSKNYVVGESFHVDIGLPNEKFVIEVDGIMHNAPIFGAAKLKKSLEADERKNNLLIAAGYTVIRIKDSGSHSKAKMRKIMQFIENSIQNGPYNKVLSLEV